MSVNRNGFRREEDQSVSQSATTLAVERIAIQIVDSHTAGEPTRVVVSGGPNLGGGSLRDRLQTMRTECDHLRRGVVLEPRGSDIVVGALLTEPDDADCAAGVIFFNNVGYLGMCGHGMIGVVRTLEHLGRILPGKHSIETPVGTVRVTLCDNGRVSVTNVPARRIRKQQEVQVDGYGVITGDVAWGGNWFFLTDVEEMLAFKDIPQLTTFACEIRSALERAGITGTNGEGIDHIEISGPGVNPDANSRNFVLCPGDAYDRSPCGTGTSAKMACLHADGKLAPGEVWRQESILGTMFEASYVVDGDLIVPTITGEAFVTSESTLIFDPDDPFRWGIA
jgi:4-hydroxyproline epimerase